MSHQFSKQKEPVDPENQHPDIWFLAQTMTPGNSVKHNYLNHRHLIS